MNIIADSVMLIYNILPIQNAIRDERTNPNLILFDIPIRLPWDKKVCLPTTKAMDEN